MPAEAAEVAIARAKRMRGRGKNLRYIAGKHLPPGQRQAIKLVKLRELSLKEAAALSGMSVASLKVATHRALKSLRRILGSRDC